MAAVPCVQFEIPDDVTCESLLSRLGDAFAFESPRAERVVHAFVDTFDWRLFQAGTVLETISGRSGTSLRWRTLGSPTPLFERPVPGAPRFAWDLPACEMRRRLEACIEMRALLPFAEVAERRTCVAMTDGEGKIVLRLELWQPRGPALPARLLLLPVRGYRGPHKQVSRFLRKRLRLPVLEVEPFTLLACGLERSPGDPAQRHSLALTRAMRSDEACKRILGELGAVVRENEFGVIEDLDSEFLHDYRVAMRRARSLLTQVKGVFPGVRADRFRNGFGWLSDLTSAPRDMDVYLLNFAEYREAVPAPLRDALEPLRDAIVRNKVEVHAKLVAALRTQRYRRLIDGWQRFSAEPVPRRAGAPNAMRPIGEVACERIWRVYRKVLAQGGAIEAESPAEALHELRKTCKKLRYLLEFFRSLFPAKAVGEAIKLLKRLQDVLGDFQDFEVQHHAIADLRERMLREAPLSPATEEALGRLLAHLARRQAGARTDFARSFADFSTKGHRKSYRRLFRWGAGR